MNAIEQFDLPKGWAWSTLGEAARVYAGSAAPQGESYFASDGPMFVRTADVGRYGRTEALDDAKDRLSSYALQKLRLLQAKPGTVLFPKSGGAVATNNRAMLSRNVYFVSHLMAVEPSKRLDAKWLYRWLCQIDMMRVADNTAYPSIKQSVAKGIPIPLPPLTEQRRIAAALDARMATVARAREAAEERLDEIGRLERRAIAASFYIRPVTTSGEAESPKGWRWAPLSDVARLESGHTPSRRRPDWWGGEVPWIALPDIRELDGRTAETTDETTNDEGLANSSARLLPEGTVVLSRTASVGFVTVMGRPMATSQDFVNWVCGPDLEPWFLAYALIASRDYLRGLSSGAVHKTIYMPTVKALRLCLPPRDEQRRIVACIEDLRRKIGTMGDAQTAQLAALDALPAVLLRAAFRGEL